MLVLSLVFVKSGKNNITYVIHFTRIHPESQMKNTYLLNAPKADFLLVLSSDFYLLLHESKHLFID